MHVRAYTSEHSGYRGRGMPKTKSPPPAGAKERGFAGFGRKRKIRPHKGAGSAWQSWAPSPKLQMAAVLTTNYVEMVKTPTIRKSRSREAPSKLPQALRGTVHFRKTPGGQGFKSKSCGPSGLDEGRTGIGACENLRMAAVLTTSSHIVVKTAVICKRRLLKTC